MTKKTIHNIAKYSLYLIPFLPLIFIEGFFYPFIITKTIFFRLLLEISFSGYLWLLIFDYQKYKPKINTALKLVFVFLAINTLAAIFGLDFYRSFFSDFERMEGVLLIIYLTLYLFLLLQFVKAKKDWYDYLRVVAIAGFLVSIYGIVQKFNLLPLFDAGTNRVTSTIGNAAFLAGYMLLAGGISYYWFKIEENKYWKLFAMAAFLLDYYILFLTATRGAILGVVFGVIVYLVLNAIYKTGSSRKFAVASLAVLFIFVSLFFYFKNSLENSSIETVRRIASTSIQDANVENRFKAWGWGWESFKDHFLLGVGIENFNYEYNRYFTPDINENWFDRTHNIYLDQLVHNGVCGLLIYLAIFCYLFYRLYLVRKTNFIVFSIFTSILIAYGIHNFFVFDALSTAFLYFFIIAFITGGREEYVEKESKDKLFFTDWRIIVLLLPSFLLLYWLVWLPLYINKNIYTGYYYVLADTQKSYNAFNKIKDYSLSSVQTGSQLNSVYEILSSQADTKAVDRQNFLQLTKDKLRQSIQHHSLEIRNRLYLAQLLINESNGEADLSEAESVLLAAKELSPTRPEIYYLLFNVYFFKEDMAKAQSVLTELIEKLPWFGDPKILLANAIKNEDPDKAEEFFTAGINQEHTSTVENNKRIIEYLIHKTRYAEAIPYYLQLIVQEPKNYDLRIDLSKLYYLTENFDKAVEEINFVNANNPDALQGSEDYLSQLQQKFPSL